MFYKPEVNMCNISILAWQIMNSFMKNTSCIVTDERIVDATDIHINFCSDIVYSYFTSPPYYNTKLGCEIFAKSNEVASYCNWGTCNDISDCPAPWGHQMQCIPIGEKSYCKYPEAPYCPGPSSDTKVPQFQLECG